MRWIWVLVLCVIAPVVRADDWPTYKGNAGRNGYTEKSLPPKLSLRWVVKEPHAPMPAWPVSNRLAFDRAHHPIIAGDSLYYGSTTDCQLHALDAATGQERWTFCTGGPIRFAPAAWKDRVFVASDDGWLYCLAAKDGKLLWKKQGGPDDRMLLGNDRMISRWPARGGPVVHDGIVTFAAGIWPTEGIHIHALDAATGKVVWTNDKAGSIYMGQPHGGAYAASGVGAQGYLVVNDEQLLVPTGRAVPASFERDTGKFKYFHLQAFGHKGGASTMAIGPYFFNAGYTYDASTGKVLDPIGAGEVASVPEGLIVSSPAPAKGKGSAAITAYQWIDKKKAEKGKLELVKYKGLEKLWTVPDVPGGAAVIVAGKHVIAGADKRVTIVDREAKKIVASFDVDGTAYGLAVANDRLYVSTDLGSLYCFDASSTKPTTRTFVPEEPILPKNNPARIAAALILRDSGVTEGYCVDLGCGDGALAYELAKRSKLHIIAIDSNPDNVALARRNLMNTGLYGVRVTVHLGDPERSNYPKHFADLVVSTGGTKEDTKALRAEMARLQRPFGGVAMLLEDGKFKKTVAGPLEGAGQWTHQYADPANTCCSTDNVIQGPLGMLWFRDSDLDGPSRHGRGPAPLFLEGRLFVEGMHAIRCVNAYNGRLLWEYPLPDILKAYHAEHLVGTAATQSNYCVTRDGLYVRAGTKCLRLDPETGKKLGEFEAPKTADGKAVPWGYIACEGGILYGSLCDTRHIVKHAYGKSDMSQLFTESLAFFAMDAITGKLKWRYDAKDSIRHNAIAIGGGKAYLIDRPLAVKDLLVGGDKDKDHPPGVLLCFDTNSGKELWRSKEKVYGTTLALSTAHDTLLMSYQPTRFKLPSEIGGRMAAFRASTGAQRWDVEAKYVTRPLINGKTVYAEGGALDLLTGEKRAFPLKRSYGCGQLAGSTHLMVFRSATLGYYDLLSPKGVVDYGGLRPGCWINAIPAGGIVMVPDATAGCQCSYLNQAWIALHPLE